MALKLTDADKRILQMLAAHDTVKKAAKALHMTPGSIEVRLWRIRRKYKNAVGIKTELDNLKIKNPSLKKYLRIRESE